jgi:hypothetical protein
VDRTGVLAGKTVVAIAAGTDHNLVLCSDGSLVAWGNGDHGQLGNGARLQHNAPVLVDTATIPAGKTIVQISGGYQRSLGLRSDGVLLAWGRTDFPGVTDKPTADALVPKAINISKLVFGKHFTSAFSGSYSFHSLGIVARDTTSPTLTVKEPAAAITSVSNVSPYVISGTASDAKGDTKGISKIEVSLNGGAPVLATLGSPSSTSTIAYSASVEPVDGTNTILISAYDLDGHVTTFTRTFTFVRRYALALARVVPTSISATPDAVGTVAIKASPTAGASALAPTTANANPKSSKVVPGTAITVTAAPKTGYVFSHWSVLPAGSATQGNVLTFTMPAADAAVTANFTESPFTTAVAGLYNGIVRGSTAATDTQNNAGLFTASVALHTGAFTGSLVIEGVKASVAGVFNPLTKKFTTLPVTNGLVYDLTLHDLATPRTITGTITKYRRTSPVAVLNVNATQGNTSFTGGPFLVAFSAPASPAPDLSDDEYPHGNGYASMTIGTKGVATLRGILADGTAFASASTVCAGANVVPVFAMFASRTGSLVGDATITAPAVTGTGFRWFRSANASHYYPHGYANGGTTGLTVDIAAGHSTAGTNLPTTVSFSGGEFSSPVAGITLGTKASATVAKMLLTAGIMKGEWAGNGSYPGKHILGGVNVNGVNYGYILSPLPLHTDGTGWAGLLSP